MAEQGFPWRGQTREPSTTLLSEKVESDILPNGNHKGGLADITNHLIAAAKSTKQPQRNNSTHTSPQPRPISTFTPAATSRSALTSRTVTDPKIVTTSPHNLQVRTIPPWVRDAEEDDLNDPALLDSPDVAIIARHHHNASGTQRPLLSGAQATQAREYPTSSGGTRPQRTSRWVTFGRASVYPRENFHHEKVSPEWLDENMTDYSRPWLQGREEGDDEFSNSRLAFKKRKQVWYKRAQFIILRNPFVPLVFRLTIFAFAVAALGLGADLYIESGDIQDCIAQNPRSANCVALVGSGDTEYYEGPSSLMAVIVDSVALVYITYITYDEYFSKPLGLRKARAKIRLVLLDLIFICFQSANLSLSFVYLSVEAGPCVVAKEPRMSKKYPLPCERAEALASVLLVSLVAWIFTFSISVLRLVERINKM